MERRDVKDLTLDETDAREHLPDVYAKTREGYRALRLTDPSGRMVGELVWRYVSDGVVEITEFGLFDEADRRKGLGTRLFEEAVKSARAFLDKQGQTLRRVYLFCDAVNDAGRAFYRSLGFTEAAVLEDFYTHCDAVLFVKEMD